MVYQELTHTVVTATKYRDEGETTKDSLDNIVDLQADDFHY